MPADPAQRPRVVLGVSGGIAAYKACEVLRGLTESGNEVRVVPTDSALRFVGEPTWAALSGHPVASGVWSDADEVPHVKLGRAAELVLVVPATANVLAKAVTGQADDLLTATLLTARCPVVYAPAMHTEMWEHAATVSNVATLRSRGSVVLEPAVGRLTGGDSGKGRLPDPAEIVELALGVLSRKATEPDLSGRHVVVSAGGTRERLDPVRFLGNRSSGRQGYALARSAAARGARVTLVAANSALPDPAGVDVVPVVSAAEMHEAVRAGAADADAIVMAAAVADFRPADPAENKIKKRGTDDAPTISLVRTADILADVAGDRARAGQVVVGFAAETGDAGGTVLDYGRRKLQAKGCDLLVVNEVGESRGFESDENEAVILGADGTTTPVPRGPKAALANVVWDLVATRLV